MTLRILTDKNNVIYNVQCEGDIKLNIDSEKLLGLTISSKEALTQKIKELESTEIEQNINILTLSKEELKVK